MHNIGVYLILLGFSVVYSSPRSEICHYAKNNLKLSLTRIFGTTESPAEVVQVLETGIKAVCELCKENDYDQVLVNEARNVQASPVLSIRQTCRSQTNPLSKKDTELFINQIRFLLKNLGFERWDYLPILVSNEYGVNNVVVFKHLNNLSVHLIAGSGLYTPGNSDDESILRAVLAHELIHIEKDHLLHKEELRNFIAVLTTVYCAAPLLSIVCNSVGDFTGSLFNSWRKSLRLLLWYYSVYPILVYASARQISLFSTETEREADLVSVQRWGTAAGLQRHLQRMYNMVHGGNFTIEEIIDEQKLPLMLNYIFGAFDFSGYPSLSERIKYLHPFVLQSIER